VSAAAAHPAQLRRLIGLLTRELETQLDLILECHCLLAPGGRPRLETLEDGVKDEVARLRGLIATGQHMAREHAP
jgi:hypothetical protein